jgi:hypothetical protein
MSVFVDQTAEHVASLNCRAEAAVWNLVSIGQRWPLIQGSVSAMLVVVGLVLGNNSP